MKFKMTEVSNKWNIVLFEKVEPKYSDVYKNFDLRYPRLKSLRKVNYRVENKVGKYGAYKLISFKLLIY